MLTYVPRTTFFPRDTLQRICSTSFSAKIHRERERERDIIYIEREIEKETHLLRKGRGCPGVEKVNHDTWSVVQLLPSKRYYFHNNIMIIIVINPSKQTSFSY